MDKKHALSVIYNCAKKYDENLKNQNIMFIIENRKFKEKISFIETIQIVDKVQIYFWAFHFFKKF